MTAFDLLRADHRQIAALFDRVRQSTDFSERRELSEEVRDLVRAHSLLEEEILYPRFSAHSLLTELMSESIEDHRLMEEILDELSLAYDPEDFDELLDDLMDTVEDHIAEEEVEVFPRLLPLLNETEWNQLRDRMLDFREGARAA